MSTWSVRSLSRLSARARWTFSADPPVLNFVIRITSSLTPRFSIHLPTTFSEELISVVTSRWSSTPIVSSLVRFDWPPPYASAVSKKVRPFSIA